MSTYSTLFILVLVLIITSMHTPVTVYKYNYIELASIQTIPS